MTAIINNTVVTGKPEEIKALLDLYNPPQVVTTAEFNIPADKPPYDMNGEGVCVNNGG